MKIVFVNQFFWPDSSATSQQLTDLVTTMAARGHEVHVLCSSGGYAQAASDAAPPAKIHRVPTLPFTRSKIKRFFSYVSFFPLALARVLTMPRMDMIVTLTTPPLISTVGHAVKMLRGWRHIIFEQDVYPDVATELGYLKRHGVLDRAIGSLADGARHGADGIVALGRCMKLRLVQRGIAARQIDIAENWADSSTITPMARPGDPSEMVLLYSGNLGLAHELRTLQQSMLALRDDPRFRFIFVGGGGRRRELNDYLNVYGVDSLEERSYVPRDRLSEGLAIGDIGLVLQDSNCSGLIVPSKVYGIMASGRPILFVGPSDATPALHIREHGCGWQVDTGDHVGLTRLLRHLAEHRDEVLEAGSRARTALLTHYDLPQGTARVAQILESKMQPHNGERNLASPAVHTPVVPAGAAPWKGEHA